MYKKIGMVAMLALAMTLAGCGYGSHSGNVNGNWTATLITPPGGTPIFAFSTMFTQGSGGTLGFTNFTFTTAGTCFATGPFSETGSVSLSGNYNGNVTGSFAMTISTMFPAGTNNMLTLMGTVAGNTITGTWTLTGGTGCSGNGNFTAIRA
jgi:hypothetical protein